MHKKICTLLFSMFISSLVLAQEEQKDPYGRDLESLTLKKRGLNSDKYSHLFIGFGFVTDFDLDNSQIIHGRSSSFSLGYLLKWRVAKFLELGFDIAYHRSAYHLRQDSSKVIPTPELHEKEKFIFNSLQTVPFIRIKLRNRSHSNGIFVDLGGFAGWQYGVKHKTVNDNLVPGAGVTQTINRDLDYKRDYVYGLLVRLGFNRIILYGRHRLTNVFTDESGFDNLPQYEVGLKIGIHQ